MKSSFNKGVTGGNGCFSLADKQNSTFCLVTIIFILHRREERIILLLVYVYTKYDSTDYSRLV